MSEVPEESSLSQRLMGWLAFCATAPVAALLAFGASRLLRPSFCTLNQQLRVWGTAFLLFMTVLVFLVEKRRHDDSRKAAVHMVVIVAFLGLLLSLWLPGLFGAVSRSRQIGTQADLRTISEAMDSVRRQTGAFPSGSSITDLGALTRRPLPDRDRWGNLFVLYSEPARYVIVSFGECGAPDQPDPWAYQPGPTRDWQADIVWLNGKRWRYPEGVQND